MLDPDDPRPPYQQVANDLRASILTRRLAPGEKLPSGPELSRHYGVARMTVQQAMRLLRDEGLIVSRQGSGVFVRARTERPAGLRPHIERAFSDEHVVIDFAGFSGETLASAIAEPVDQVRAGRISPQSITVRIMVPDPARPWGLPCRVEDLADDPAFRARAAGITGRSVTAIAHAVRELGELGLVQSVSCEVRAHAVPPTFKIYLINRRDAFFGFYPVTEHTVTLADEQRAMFDLMGRDATLFLHDGSDPESIDGQFVVQASAWFDSVWNSIAEPFTPTT